MLSRIQKEQIVNEALSHQGVSDETLLLKRNAFEQHKEGVVEEAENAVFALILLADDYIKALNSEIVALRGIINCYAVGDGFEKLEEFNNCIKNGGF